MRMSESQNAEQAMSKEETETAESERPLDAVHLMHGPASTSAQEGMGESGGVARFGRCVSLLMVGIVESSRLHASTTSGSIRGC